MCLLTVLCAQMPAFAALQPQSDSRQSLASAKAALDAAVAREQAAPTKRNGIALDRALAMYNAAAAARRADIIARLNALGDLMKQNQAQGLDIEDLGKEHDALLAEASSLPSSNAKEAPMPATTPEVEPNDTPATANTLALGAQSCTIVTGTLSPAGDDDYFRFTTTAANAQIWAYSDTGGPIGPLGSTRDTQLTLFGADGVTMIEFDDDDGSGNGGDGTSETGFASSIAGRDLPTPGTYFLRVQDFCDNGVIDPYRLFIVVTTGPATPEVEPNNTCATAQALNTATFPNIARAAGAISPAADEDWYAVTATAGNALYISLDNDPERDGSNDLDVALFAADCTTQLFQADSDSPTSAGSCAPFASPDLSEAFWWNVLVTGTYYVRVRDIGNTATGTYELLVAACSSDAPPPPPPPAGCTLTCPANVNASATSPNGAIVTFPNPTTTGTCGPVTCTPASGTLFPVGTTQVICQEAAGTASVVTTYSSGSTAVPIPATGSTGSMTPQTITITDPGTVTDVDVRIRLNHTWDSDLDISLTAPNGAVIDLSSDNGGSGDNYGTGANDCTGTKTVFSDEAAASITTGTAPFAGTFMPETPLTVADGIPVAGNWTLNIFDDASGDVGVLGCWELVITRTVTTAGATCTFNVAVTIPFDICYVHDVADPTQQDVFRAVVNRPLGDPLRGYYEYYNAETGETFTGIAESVSYRPGASLVMYDRDDPDQFLYVSANIAAGTATVQFIDRTSGREFVLRDTNIRDLDTREACAARAAAPPVPPAR